VTLLYCTICSDVNDSAPNIGISLYDYEVFGFYNGNGAVFFVMCELRLFFNVIQLIYHWGDQDVGGMIILRWIFRGFAGTGWSWLRIGTGGGRL
jgi:hypothetical protein